MKTAQGKGHKAPAGSTREEQNENKNKNTQIYDIYIYIKKLCEREKLRI